MFEVVGKKERAIIYSDRKDEKAIEQIKTLCDIGIFKHIRIMPDYHAGKGCVVGFTAEIRDKVIPNIVGVDIGCGVTICRLDKSIRIDLPGLDRFIYEHIPSGLNIRDNVCKDFGYAEGIIESLYCKDSLHDIPHIIHSMGTLGGGNHFIELDKDSEGYIYLVVHTGSRNLGKQVCEYYQDLAVQRVKEQRKQEIRDIIKNTEPKLRQKKLEEIHKEQYVPTGLEYISGKDMEHYLHDMDMCVKYSFFNRVEIIKDILRYLDLNFNMESIRVSLHNYIDTKTMIIRKGAIKVDKGELCYIPISMSYGTLECEGLGNREWNNSAPHGAGRLMSRTEARRTLNGNEFQSCMAGIYTTSVGEDTIDEAPMAYKTPGEIISSISDQSACISDILRPVYNFKAHDSIKFHKGFITGETSCFKK